MVSIVVCSINDELFDAFSQNVAVTIGVPYEIIRINNKNNIYSICGAYNQGIELSNFDTVCFIHEDILFETSNWGEKLLDIFKDPNIGLVGVLGICYLSLFPTGWIDIKECEGQLRVSVLDGAPIHKHVRFPGKNLAEVAAVDGIFLATKKSALEKIKFSDDILKGFHGYDIDFSLQIRQTYKVVVTREILVNHFSGGTYNQSYWDTLATLAIKWDPILPVYSSNYSKDEVKKLKIKSLKVYMEKPGLNKIPNSFKYARKQGIMWEWLYSSLFTK